MSKSKKLYGIYRLFTIKYGIEIVDVSTFIKYVYAMDVLWLNVTYSPFIWEDYIFIDQDMIDSFIKKNLEINDDMDNKYDELAQIDHDFAIRIINESIINRLEYKIPINHIDHLPKDGIDYYEETKENTFFFDNGKYENRLRNKRREVNLNKILN